MWPNSVTKKDLEIEFCRGGGKGGQNRNKRDTACRITHIPTGISVRAEDQRTQEANKKLAFKRLCDKLVPLMKAAAKRVEIEPSKQRIRTYNEHRNSVIDDRIEDKIFDYDDVINGNGFNKIIKELYNAE